MIKDVFKEVELENSVLRSHAENFIASLQKKPATALTYQKALNEFIEFAARGKFRFTVEDVLKYKRYLDYKKKMTKYSASTYLTSLRQFCIYLLGIGVIEKNPARRVNYKIKDRVVKFDYLTKEQVSALISEISDVDKQGTRDKALLSLMIYAGLSEEQIPNILFADFQRQSNKKKFTLSVKNQSGYTQIELSNETVKLLQDYIKTRESSFSNEPLFISMSNRSGKSAITKRGVREIVLQRLKGASFAKESGIKLTPHTLSHTAAILYAESGAKSAEVAKRFEIKSDVTLKKIFEAAKKNYS